MFNVNVNDRWPKKDYICLKDSYFYHSLSAPAEEREITTLLPAAASSCEESTGDSMVWVTESTSNEASTNSTNHNTSTTSPGY